MHVYGPHVWHLQNTSPYWPMAGPQLRDSRTLLLKAPGPNQGGKDPRYWPGKWRQRHNLTAADKLHQALMTASLKGVWGLWMSDLISQSSISCMHAKLLQLCPTLCNPMDYSPPGSSVHRILQARILEWVAMPSSRGSSWPKDQIHASCISSIAVRFFTHWAKLYCSS